MPKSCSVPYCKSRYSINNKEVTFHRFPFSRPDLLGEWIARIGYANFNPKRHTVICSAHFIPDCFSKYGNRKNLKENAIPTVFMSEDQRLEKLLQYQERVEKKHNLKKLRRKQDLQSKVEDLKQFSDDNASASAASLGIRDAPRTLTRWIPKVGVLLCEKIALKKEFGPSYRASLPVLGINGTRTVILQCSQVLKNPALSPLTV
ncbi:THAP domain-containing protein 3 isoform X2 [Pleurodeles waltl]|uniref:THAP domain-containing protein 3 isoform X2 n=1 Tax=Pleurodeles waltl TaxID=8319 RepID=UPI003709A89A